MGLIIGMNGNTAATNQITRNKSVTESVATARSVALSALSFFRKDRRAASRKIGIGKR